MKKKDNKSMTSLANAAFKQAAREVIRRAVETGTSVIVWEDGAIQAKDPREVQLRQTKGKSASEGNR